MSSGPALRSFLPKESIPFLRIARYACYALVVFAVGTIFADVVFGALDVFTGVINQFLGSHIGWVWRELLNFVREIIRTFALLVALGVFLTQFE